MVNHMQSTVNLNKAHNNTPTWSQNPENIRIRQDIPNARNTEAGKEIIRQTRFLGGIGGLAVGLIAGTIGGIITFAVAEPHLSNAGTLGVTAGTAGASAIGGVALGRMISDRTSKINLAEAELGILNSRNNHFVNLAGA